MSPDLKVRRTSTDASRLCRFTSCIVPTTYLISSSHAHRTFGVKRSAPTFRANCLRFRAGAFALFLATGAGHRRRPSKTAHGVDEFQPTRRRGGQRPAEPPAAAAALCRQCQRHLRRAWTTPSATPATGPARWPCPAQCHRRKTRNDRFDGLPAADGRGPQSKSEPKTRGRSSPSAGLSPGLRQTRLRHPWHASGRSPGPPPWPSALAIPGTLPLTLLTGLFITVTDADRAPPGGR